MKILLRTNKPADTHYIYNSWLVSYRNSDFARHMPNDVYYNHHKLLIGALLSRSITTVACNPEDEDQIYGYAVYENVSVPILHFIYVKYAFRGFGIEKMLIDSVQADREIPLFITHAPWNFRALKEEFNLIHNIYLLIRS
jgi:hypothetical protein